MKTTAVATKSNLLIAWLTTVALFVLSAVPSWGQVAEAIIISPVDSAGSVALKPEITLRTNYPIDSSSIRNYHDQDSSAIGGDSTLENLIEPNILVLDKLIYDNVPDSLHKALGVNGEMELVDDSTLVYRPKRLQYGTEYVALVSFLRVVKPLNDTVIIGDTSIIYFTTVLPPHKLYTTSLYTTPEIRCSDTLWLEFNRPLDSVDAEDVAMVAKLEWNDSLSCYDTTEINADYWFDVDKTRILIDQQSGSFQPGEVYSVIVKPSILTGDPLDNTRVTFQIKEHYDVNMVGELTDTLGPLPTEFTDGTLDFGRHIYSVGDTVVLSAPEFIDDYRFVVWESDEDSVIDGDSTNTIGFVYTCNEAQDISIRAIYEPIPLDTVEVNVGTNGIVKVYDNDGDYIGGTGTYILKLNESISLSAEPDSLYRFAMWTSTGGTLLDATKPMLQLSYALGGPSIPATVTARFGLTGAPLDYELKVNIVFIDPTDILGIDPLTVVSLSPNDGTGLPNEHQYTVSEGTSNPHTITATILNSCFEIASIGERLYIPSINDHFISDFVPPSTSFFSKSYNSTSPISSVQIRVRRKTFQLQAEKFNNVTSAYIKNEDTKAVLKVYEQIGSEFQLSSPVGTIDLSGDMILDDAFIYEFKCGVNVKVMPEYDDSEFGFNSWQSGGGYFFSTTEELATSMSQNRKVRAKFDAAAFDVISVGVYETSTSVPTHHPLDEYPRRNILMMSTGGTDLVIRFNQSVDVATLAGNFYIDELFERIDNHLNMRYVAETGNFAWSTFNGKSNSQLTIKLMHDEPVLDDIFAQKLQDMVMHFTTGIESSTGTPLSSHQSAWITTENPSVEVWFDRLEIINDRDDGFKGAGDMYTITNVEHIRTANSVASAARIPSDPNEYDDLDNGEAINYNRSLYTIPQVQDHDMVTLLLATYDEDSGPGISEEVLAILDSLELGITIITVVAGVPILLPLARLGTILRILQGTGALDDSDDQIGQNSWVYGRADWWGGRPSLYDEQHEVEFDDAIYTVRFVLE